MHKNYNKIEQKETILNEIKLMKKETTYGNQLI
jgi:hypothetical protein